jgi:hypothetical protein
LHLRAGESARQHLIRLQAEIDTAHRNANSPCALDALLGREKRSGK